jgi:hypothetical protein
LAKTGKRKFQIMVGNHSERLCKAVGATDPNSQARGVTRCLDKGRDELRGHLRGVA